MEVYYRSLEAHGSRAASDVLGSFSKYLIDFDSEDIAGSMKLRLDLKRKGHDISYADALGYFLSRKMGAKFLTGNKTFKRLDGVEYLE